MRDDNWVAFARPAERMRVLQVTPCANPEVARTLLKIQHTAYALEAPLSPAPGYQHCTRTLRISARLRCCG